MNTTKKKLICAVSAAAVTVSSLVAAPGCALGKDISVVLNGAELSFGVQPKLVNGTVLVPMRKIFEELGMTVSWNGGNSTVTAVKNGKSVTAQIGSKTVTVNGTAAEADAAPVLENGTVLVPLSIISDALGVDVSWSDETGTAVLTKEKSAADESWKEHTGLINLTSMTAEGGGASINGKVITITEGGDYTVTGSAADAMLLVNSESRVKLRLSGVRLTNTSGPAIFFENCDKGYITISSGTENYLSDGAEYATDAKGTVFSNDDLEIKGSGSLTVVSNYNHGIVSDDEVKIEEGTIAITAVGDGIHANDGVTVSGGKITVKASGDGIQSENFTEISGGEVNIVTDGEVEADSAFGWGERQPRGGRFGNPPEGNLSEGNLPKMTENGMQNGNRPMGNPPEGNPPQMPQSEPPQGNPPEMSGSVAPSLPSSKGIKAETNLIISGGEISVSSNDHCLHSSGIVFISGGNMQLSSEKKKGIAAHTELVIDGGSIDITKSSEGIESKAAFCINGGTIRVKSSDDGLNAGGTGGRDVGSGTDEHSLYINGGYVYINANGDGVDSNGTMYMRGGTVIVNGPSGNGNGALDSGGSIITEGGTLIASGSSGMAEYPRGEGCTQAVFCCNFAQSQAANTIVRIEDAGGNEILTYHSPKSFQSIVYSSPLLKQGETYRVILGGEYSGGADNDGILSGGEYSGGTLTEKFTLNSVSTAVGTSGCGFSGRGGRM